MANDGGGQGGGEGIDYSDNDADPTDGAMPVPDPLDAARARTDPADEAHPAERRAGGEPVVTEASADQSGMVGGEHGFSEVSPDTRQAD